MRTVLTVAGIAIAVGTVVALVGIAGSFERSMYATLRERGIDLMVVRAGGLQRINSLIDEQLVPQIRQIRGVRDASGGLVETFSFEDLDLFGVVARGVAPESFVLRSLKILAGRSLRTGDQKHVIVGKLLAANLGKQTGESLELVPGESFQIVGIFESSAPLENGSMIVPLPELQRLMDLQGKVTVVTVVTENSDPASIEAVRQQIRKLGQALEVLGTGEFIDNAVEIRMTRTAAWLTSTLALVLGAIGMVNTLHTAVFERTRELAILRAVGWRKSSIVKLILRRGSRARHAAGRRTDADSQPLARLRHVDLRRHCPGGVPAGVGGRGCRRVRGRDVSSVPSGEYGPHGGAAA
jgi:putative ABC transport system permease protein